jgi:hypothetical protein
MRRVLTSETSLSIEPTHLLRCVHTNINTFTNELLYSASQYKTRLNMYTLSTGEQADPCMLCDSSEKGSSIDLYPRWHNVLGTTTQPS